MAQKGKAKKQATNRKKMKSKDKGENKLSPLKSFLGKSDVLLMLYPKDINGFFSKSIQPEDEITVYELLKEKNTEKKNLLIFLDTSGGNVYSAVKIMDTLRTRYREITIAVPQEAKSSGTMMCCGADRIIMSPISELGPLLISQWLTPMMKQRIYQH